MKNVLFCLICFLTFKIISAQSVGEIDTTFNNKGSGNTFGFTGGFALVAKVHQNGKILVGGTFDKYKLGQQKYLAQLNPDGTLDPTLNATVSPNKPVRAMAIQNDGKILIAGDFDTCGGVKTPRIVRVNSDGTIDNTFSAPEMQSNNTLTNVIVQSDKKILVTSSYNIFRLDSTGKMDSVFLTNRGTGTTNGFLHNVALQSDGKIILGGTFTYFNSAPCNLVIRLNSDGTIDNSFAATGIASNARIYTLKLQVDGKVLVGGDWSSSGSVRTCIARLNSDGSKDTTFTAFFNDVVRTIEVQNDGKIIVAGSFLQYKSIYKPGICRLNYDGSLDSIYSIGIGINNKSFDPVNFGIYSIAKTYDGKIFISGAFISYNNYYCSNIARLDSLGEFDPTFNTTTWANGPIFSMAVQPDDKIIIGGYFSRYNNVPISKIGRLNADGTLDNSFNTGSGTDAEVATIAIQTDGKILIGGYFKKFNGVDCGGLARLNTDGSLDNSFNFINTNNITPYAIAIQPSGKILVGNGLFNTPRLLRLNSDGSIDSTFNAGGTGPSGFVRSICFQTDSKIIIAGNFSSYNGVQKRKVARLNEDGTLDSTFTPYSIGGSFPTSYLDKSIVLRNGKIVIAGEFSYNLFGAKSGVMQLLSSGAIDSSFNIGTGAKNNAVVHTLKEQPDGKILVGGEFSIFNGYYLSGLARLLPTGEFDTIFNLTGRGTGFVYAIENQSDNKILASGIFQYYNESTPSSIVRVLNDVVDSTNVGLQDIRLERVNIYPNPFHNSITIEGSEMDGATIYIHDIYGRTVKEVRSLSNKQEISLSNLLSGSYFVSTTKNGQTSKPQKVLCIK